MKDATGIEISVNRKILRGILSGGGLTVITTIVSVVQLRLILDFLTTDVAGMWLLFLSVGAYIAFFDFGISPTLSREIGFLLGRKDSASASVHEQQVADLLATCWRMFTVLACVAFVFGLVLMGVYLWYQPLKAHQTEIQLAWLIFLLGASINIFGGAAFAALYGMGDVATERIIRSGMLLFGLGLAYLSLYFGYGIIGLAVSWLIQNLVARLIALWVLYANHPWIRNAKGHARKDLFFNIAAPSFKWAAMGFGAILILQTDNIIIATMLGTGFIPQYEAVAKMAVALMTLSLLIVNSSTPFLSRAYAAGQHEQVVVLLLKNVQISMFSMAVLVPYMAVFGGDVVDVWLGPGNFIGNPVLWTMLVMVFLEVHHVALASATMATGRIAFMWVALVAGVLNILISLVLVRQLGIWGVALGTMIAQMLTNNWYAPYITFKHFGVSMKVYLIKVVFPVLGLLGLCVILDILIRIYLLQTGVAFIVALSVSGLIIGGMVNRYRSNEILHGCMTIKFRMLRKNDSTK